MKNLIGKFNNNPWIVFLSLIISFKDPIQALISKNNAMTFLDFFNGVHWGEAASLFVFSTLVYLTIRRCNSVEKILSASIAENNEKLKQAIINEFAPVHATQANLFIEIRGKIDGLTNHFNNLSDEFSSFSLYNQGNVALVAGDFKGAYSGYISSVKHSISSGNLQNISTALKVIKHNVLPRLCKSDIEMLKNDTALDIEDMFKHIALMDDQKLFTLDVKDIRAAVNRLPQTIPTPSLEDIIPEKTFIGIDTEKGYAKVNLIAIRQAFTPFESQLNEMLLHNKNVFNGLQRSFYIILHKQGYRITCLKNKEDGSKNGEIKHVADQLYATATQDAPIMEIKEYLAHYYNMTVKELEIIIANN